MSNTTMMKCGHAANGKRHNKASDEWVDCCVICSVADDGDGNTVDDDPPDLSQRRARCGYYGSTPSGRSHEGFGCSRGEPCLCETASDASESRMTMLAFFEHRPDHEFDSFYCGCWGWD